MGHTQLKFVFAACFLALAAAAIPAKAGPGNLGWADKKSGETSKSRNEITFSKAFAFIRPYAAFMKSEYKSTIRYSGYQGDYSSSNSEFMPQIAVGLGYRLYSKSPLGFDAGIVVLANGGIYPGSGVAILSYFDAGPEVGYTVAIGRQRFRPFISLSAGLSVPINNHPVDTDLTRALRIGVEGRVHRNLALVLGFERVSFASLDSYDFYGYDYESNTKINPSLSGVFLSARFYLQ